MSFLDYFDTSSFSDLSSWIGPALSAGAVVAGSMAQSDAMKDSAKKQAKSYKDYLSTINPPEEVKQTRFNEMKDQVLSSAPIARRRLEDRLASRGIRGGGTASPIGSQESQIQDALNDAYFKVYGQYNVPSSPGPSSATPGGGDLLAMNAGQVGSYLLPSFLKKLDPSKLSLSFDGSENSGSGDSDYWNWMYAHPAGR